MQKSRQVGQILYSKYLDVPVGTYEYIGTAETHPLGKSENPVATCRSQNDNFAGKLRWRGALQYNTHTYMGYYHTIVGCEEDPPVTCVIAVTDTLFLNIYF